jgi:hypothetical protein
MNPQLGVETRVYALSNDPKALDFVFLDEYTLVDGVLQTINVPRNTCVAV